MFEPYGNRERHSIEYDLEKEWLSFDLGLKCEDARFEHLELQLGEFIMRKKPVTVGAPCISFLGVVLLLLSLFPFSSSNLPSADAEPSTAISPTDGTGSPASLGTIITSGTSIVPTPLCTAECVITGGTRAGNNLFHSFGDFDIGALDSARFQTGLVNPLPDSNVSNILARVTGGSSSLFGSLDSATYYPSANLFLMNPAGFLFGPNATVNVGGMMTFTTADRLHFTDNVRFNAIPDGAADVLLSSAPVAAFGFIGSNPNAINFKGGQLTVASGTGLALIGGDINLIPDSSATPSSITAPGRPIQLTSVAGKGLVAANTGMPEPGMALGTITLGQDTNLSAAGDASFGDGSGGSISIRGGQFVATGATIITSPYTDFVSFSSTGSGGDIAVNVTGAATLADSFIQTNSLVAGNAGSISLAAKTDLTLTNSIIDSTSINDSGTVGALGNGGAVTLTTEEGILSMGDSLILTVANNAGNGGAVTIMGKDVTFNRAAIFTDVDATGFDVIGNPALGQVHPGAVTVTGENTVMFSGSFSGDPGIAVINAKALGTLVDAGGVTITGKTVNLSNGTVDTTMSNQGIISPGNGGAIEIQGNSVNLTQFQLFSNASGPTQSTGTGGSILLRGVDSIQANNIQLTASRVDASAVTGEGGGPIEFQTEGLTLSDGTIVTTSSLGPGSGGTITIGGAENVTIESGSQVLTDVVLGGPLIPQGTAGDILFETQNLAVLSGGKIGARTLINSTGNAGNITVQGNSNNPAESVLIDGPGSGIFTTTEGTGEGGNINLFANTVTVQNGGTLSAATSGTEATATGGSIIVNTTDHVIITNGASISAATTGSGDAGNIMIDGGSLTVASGGRIEASTSGAGDGGSIDITTTGDVTVSGISSDGQTRSGIFAKTLSADSGSGGGSGGGGGGSGGGGGGAAPKPGKAGDITIEAKNLLLDEGAQIDSSTTSGGAGGTVSIKTAENITIAGSSTRLTSDATRGDGKGGNIILVAKNITVRDRANITAVTGGKGDAGTVTLTALDQLLLQSAGTITTSTSGPGKGGTIMIQANQILLDGQGTTITADTLRPFADMTITIDILHPNDGELVVQLESPTGTRVALLSRVGGSGDNFTDTQFNDQATTPITSGSAPFTGEFKPREPMGQLNNQLVAGDWTLNVRDQATGTVGSLESWTLQIGDQTFQSTGGSTEILGNGENVQSTITVTNPTVPNVQGVGEPSGSGGNVTINAGSVAVQNGATMSATTRGSGQGGTLTVNATDAVALTGSSSGLFTDSQGSGTGGSVALTAGHSVTILDGASVTASSTGSGNAGNIHIDAGQTFVATNSASAVTTQAKAASGGDITLVATDRVQLNNSQISTSVVDGSGGGGDISIDPQYVILQNSQILAQADQGQGGAIAITTNLFLQDATSLVSADSRSGLDGTVRIQSPISPASGKIQPLGNELLEATSLLNQRCAALTGGEFSSFTVAGRDSLPTEPGSWLASPLVAFGAGEALGVRGEGIAARGEGQGVRGEELEGKPLGASLANESTLLSLRQIAPTGFLTQAFAQDWSAGCT
ncbi:MAG: filamentous hemagglutinin N-terminal domain-containing protein, partial [Nitrospira sp.]|nr:filamentous hemagglutinin N-terminal domain-containing protein [Nitrospira sp.]